MERTRPETQRDSTPGTTQSAELCSRPAFRHFVPCCARKATISCASMPTSSNSPICRRRSGTASWTIMRIAAAKRQRSMHRRERSNAVNRERYGGNSPRAQGSLTGTARPPTAGFERPPKEGHGILPRHALRPTRPPVQHRLGCDGGTRRRHFGLAIRSRARVTHRRRQRRYVRCRRRRRRGQADGAWRSRTRGPCQRLSMLHRVAARHRGSHPAPDRVAR